MNYDYKIVNTDPTLAFFKRSLLYVAILSLTVALALVILFILFERYLMLLLPGGMILFFVVVAVFVGWSPSFFAYHFTDSSLVIEGNGKKIASFSLQSVLVDKKAEKSEFSSKEIVKYAFSSSRIVLKNAVNESNQIQIMLVTIENQRFLMALDDYALSIIRRSRNGV